MALKAGYIGVKRRLYEKLQAIILKNVQDIADIWTYNNRSGVTNKLKITADTTTVTDVTFTIDPDGLVSISSSGAIAANRDLNLTTTLSLKEGDKVKIGFADSDTDKVRMTIYNNSTPAQVANSFGKPVQYTAQSTGSYTVYIRAINGKTFDNYIIKPMVYDAMIPDPDFASFAMTNVELTKNIYKQFNADSYFATEITAANLNNHITPKSLVWSGSNAANITNKPSDFSASGMLQVMRTWGEYCRQILYPRDSAAYYYMRVYQNGVWSSWYKYVGTEVTPPTQSNATPETRSDDPDLVVEEEPVEVVKKATRTRKTATNTEKG